MSPRTKENERNKVRIEHMLWRVDTVFEKKDAHHKIVEREDDYLKSQHVSDISIKLKD